LRADACHLHFEMARSTRSIASPCSSTSSMPEPRSLNSPGPRRGTAGSWRGAGQFRAVDCSVQPAAACTHSICRGSSLRRDQRACERTDEQMARGCRYCSRLTERAHRGLDVPRLSHQADTSVSRGVEGAPRRCATMLERVTRKDVARARTRTPSRPDHV
jgi:hypothetical protein